MIIDAINEPFLQYKGQFPRLFIKFKRFSFKLAHFKIQMANI